MDTPSLLYGIGATKAGTSWLHAYLQKHPDCAVPLMKELHYFDFLETGNHDGAMARLAGLRGTLSRDLEQAEKDRRAKLQRRLDEMDRWTAVVSQSSDTRAPYVDFMRGLADARVVADVTPAYATLSRDTLAEMAALNGGNTRFLYILRDPIDRLWSHIRMVLKRKAPDDPTQLADRILRRAEAGKEHLMLERSDYSAALAKLSDVVPDDRRLVLFFEELFTDATIRRICSFLEVDYMPAMLQRHVHKGIEHPWTPAQFRRMGKLVSPQYDAVQDYMGGLPARWQTHAAKMETTI
ncbi:sulfotransferase [Pseudaestuariivita rosea]|uniref:sulfotransferase n=1 Tax=Pseudaestuariivita rosea TaxID=2763263 RepID=UPI001ABACBBC|nr:sulfotransferase [Pseudaestuariivita rosea]